MTVAESMPRGLQQTWIPISALWLAVCPVHVTDTL